MESRLAKAIGVILEELDIAPTAAEDLTDWQLRQGLPTEIAEEHGRMVMIALVRGNKEMAYRIINRAFEAGLEEKNIVSSESNIESVFPAKLANKLLQNELKTIKDVLRFSLIELSKIDGFSIISALSVEKVLDKHGLSLSNPQPKF